MQLEKRVSALEQGNPADRIDTIIRRIVSPGHLDAEISYAQDTHGHEWMCQPGETEDAFIDRAAGETKANVGGIKRLIVSRAEEHHAES